MQIIKKQEKIGNILFAIAIILELIIMVAGHSAFNLPYSGRIAQFAFILFGCKILSTEYSKKQWAVIVMLGILGAISYFTCGDEYVLRAIVMVTAAKDIDVNKTFKIVFTALIVGTLLIVLTSLVGIGGEMIETRDFGRGGIETRWKFGFSHANNIHDVLWYLTSIYLFIKGKTTKWKDYVIITALNLSLFAFTVSRNGLLATQILVCACAFFRYLPKMQEKLWPYLLGLLGLVLCIFFTFLGGLYCINNNELMRFFDRIFTGRLEMVWEYAPVASWEWFPDGRQLLYIDNGFVTLLFCYGIVIGVGYWLLNIYAGYLFYKEKNGIGLAILVTTIFVTFMEASFVINTSVLCNPLLLFLFDRWYRNREVEKVA